MWEALALPILLSRRDGDVEVGWRDGRTVAVRCDLDAVALVDLIGGCSVDLINVASRSAARRLGPSRVKRDARAVDECGERVVRTSNRHEFNLSLIDKKSVYNGCSVWLWSQSAANCSPVFKFPDHRENRGKFSDFGPEIGQGASAFGRKFNRLPTGFPSHQSRENLFEIREPEAGNSE